MMMNTLEYIFIETSIDIYIFIHIRLIPWEFVVECNIFLLKFAMTFYIFIDIRLIS